MHPNPALKSLKRQAKPLIPMFFPLFCAKINIAEFHYPDQNGWIIVAKWRSRWQIRAFSLVEKGLFGGR